MAKANAKADALPVRFSWNAWPVHAIWNPSGSVSRSDFFDGRNCIARAHAFASGADEARGDVAIEALEQFRTDDLADLHQRLERDHLAAGLRADVDLAEIVRFVAERRFRLHLHAERATVNVEVVDVERAHRALQGLEHFVHRHAERQCLFAVDFDAQLRYGSAIERVDACQPGICGELLLKLAQHLSQSRGIRRAARLQISLEAAGGAEAADRGRVEGDRGAAANRARALVHALGDVRGQRVAVAPGLQDDEQRRRAALRAAADDVVAVDDVDVLELREVRHHLLELR